MKTYEFKINLDSQQEQLISSWLDTLTGIWNRAIALYEWRQFYLRYKKCLEVEQISDWGFDIKPTEIHCFKVGEDWVYSSAIGGNFRLDKSKGWEDESNLEWRGVVNLVKPHWISEPLVTGYSAIDLRKPFAQKRYPELKDKNIPMVLVNDYLKIVVAQAWENYIKGTARKPKYKNHRRTAKTIASESFRGHCRVDWDSEVISFPGKLKLKVPNLKERLYGADISTFKIVKKAKDYFLQLGWKDAPERKGRAKKKSTTLIITENYYHDLGANLKREIPKYLLQKTELLKREQQKLSRCEYGSNRWLKQKKKVASIHEKIKLQREGWQKWHSSNLSDIYEEIIVQPEVPTNLVAKPNPIFSPEKEVYLPNGATEIALKNQLLSDLAISAFKEMLTKKGVRVVEHTQEKVEPKKKVKKAKKTPKSDIIVGDRKTNRKRKRKEVLVEKEAIISS